MIIVGEKINTSRKSIREAVERKDTEYIVKIARDQVSAGADFIDVNAGTFVNEEVELLCWLVDTIQAEIDTPLCLDSPNPQALAAAMDRHRGEPMINSISMEAERLEPLLPVVTSRPCRVIALCMAENAMPTTVDERFEVAANLIQKLQDGGFPLEKIHVDPLIQPISVDTNMGLAALGAIKKVMESFEGVNTICGLSNISFGLPERPLINRNFLALAISYGLNGAILDPNDNKLMSTLVTVNMLLGNDWFCEKYIEAYHQGILGGAA